MIPEKRREQDTELECQNCVNGAMNFRRCFLLPLASLLCLSTFTLAAPVAVAPPMPRPSVHDYNRARAEAKSHLLSLSNDQLMQEYNDPGCLVSLAPYETVFRYWPAPWAGDFSHYALCYNLFLDIKTEIVRRGAPMAPLLIEFLEHLPPKPRLAPTPAGSGVGCWYDSETINLLAQIRDPRAAEELLHLLADDGKTKRGWQYEAEGALESLTYCCFYQSGLRLNILHEGLTVPRLEASRVCPDFMQEGDYQTEAAFYRNWLAGKGKDPARWLPLARYRARTMLATDDPVLINDAALFLTYSDHAPKNMPHDDAPDETLKRLAEVAAQVRQDGKEIIYADVTRPKYLYQGQTVSSDVGDLSRFLFGYGRRAQPYAATLIRLQRQSDAGPIYAYGALGGIGGKEVMTFLAECLPKLDTALQKAGLDQNPYLRLPLELEKMPREPKAQLLILAYRACHFGFDREAGRTFVDTPARRKWWGENKDKTEEQWLRENLKFTALDADNGNTVARVLLQWIVPDMPCDPHAPIWMPVNQVITVSDGAAATPLKPILRAAWLKANAKRLRFDPDQDCLRLH